MLCGIENWTLKEDEQPREAPGPKPHLQELEPGPTERSEASEEEQEQEQCEQRGGSIRGEGTDRVEFCLDDVMDRGVACMSRYSGNYPYYPPLETGEEQRQEVSAPPRRTYQRPWSANMATDNSRAQSARRARPHSAKTQPELRPIKAQEKKKEQKNKQVQKKRREEGWNDRFSVKDPCGVPKSSSTSRPVCFNLSKAQLKHSKTVGMHGKLLPWLDPKKQIKRKPLVDSAPFALPKRRVGAA